MNEARRPLVEVLYFDGCPNHEPAAALVERVGRELGIEPELRLVRIADQAAAERLRFLGSPTIRVDGADIDPHAGARTDYALSCRVFETGSGFSGQPDGEWVREALLGAGARAGPAAERALEAARIPAARCGAQRAARLTGPERELYRWILDRFARAVPPTVEQVTQTAHGIDLDHGAALATLAREDLVHVDEAGTILVAYPFSARPRGHRVTIDGSRTIEAMCAIDALGIAPMLGLPVETISHDPRTGAEIRVRLAPGGAASWQPGTAVVLAGSACCDGPSFRGCCDIVDFFESSDSAQRYLGDHADLVGVPIPIPEAIAAGRVIFADIFAGF